MPASVDDLAEIYAANPDATLVSGATDVGLWVTKFMRDIGPMIYIGHLAELHRIDEGPGALTLGAGVTYTEASGAIARHFPQLTELWDRIGGAQVRNAGTIGANIANGSPIGDTPPPFIVLGAHITLRKGSAARGEAQGFLYRLWQAGPAAGRVRRERDDPLSARRRASCLLQDHQRKDEDISALCGAFRVFVNDDGNVGMARIAFGGMAATPKRAKTVEDALVGKPWTHETIEAAAVPAFVTDFTPLTDMRASRSVPAAGGAELLRRFYLETIGQGERLAREVA